MVTEMIKQYVDRGIHVELLLLNNTETSFFQNLMIRVPGLKVHKFNNNWSIYNPLYIFKLKPYLNKFDIIHVHLFPVFYWAAFAKVLSLKKHKLIYTEHNTSNRRRKNPILKRVDKFIYKRYNRIITISDSVDDILRLYLKNDQLKITKIYNGIDLEAVKIASGYNKEELGLKSEIKLLIQVSSFTPQKNQSTLIKSLVGLNADIHLVLVGDGPLKEEAVKLTTALKLSDRVHFLGIRNDVPKLLKTADIVVLSSHFEGLSLACLEGLASGRPFIGSHVNGITEVIQNAGILFENNDVKSLQNAITTLFSNRSLYDKTVENCLRASEQYDIKKLIENHLMLYNQVINEK